LVVLPKGQGILSSSLTVYLEDDTGQSIPDVEIKLLNTSKNILKTQSTDNNGIAVFNKLKDGNYYVRINKQTGYHIFDDKPVAVNGDTDDTVVLELE